MGKLGSALACLLFAVPFGGVGVFATWAIGSTLHDAWRAREWVPVKASVQNASLATSSSSDGDTTYRAVGTYRYAYGGTSYSGSRLGFSAIGGADNIDDWHQEVTARLEGARTAGRPVDVWVDPANPAESVLDRGIRWGELLFLLPFSLAFGGVGVGALVAMVYVLKGKGPGSGERTQAALDQAVGTVARGGKSGGDASARFLWIFAFLWNAMSWPIAILVVRDVAENGEWLGLLVLLFPLVGLLVLWGAIATTWKAITARRRAATPSSAPAAASMARRAERALFERPAAAFDRPKAMPSAAPPPAIPPELAEVEDKGGVLAIRYRPRRRLGLVIALGITGLFLAGFGVVFLLADDNRVVGIVILAVSAIFDVAAAGVLVGRLAVTAKAGELNVERVSLAGRKSWRIRGDSIRAIRPVQAYAINEEPYYSIMADLGTEQIALGNSIKGEALADAVAQRIAAALGLDAFRVARVEPCGEAAEGTGA